MTIRDKGNYMKLRKIGASITLSEAERQYGGKFNQNVYGWWWPDDDARILQDDINNAEPRNLTKIIIIIDGRVYNEDSSGLISKSGKVAYITYDKFQDLL